MPKKYNLRNQSTPSDKGPKSSPLTSRLNPKSPNASGYSSSHSYRANTSLNDDSDDQFTDSQEENDEGDFSYPSTTFSSSAATPSPKQTTGRKGAGSSGSDTSRTPSSFSHLSPLKTPESHMSPKETSRIYPDLPDKHQTRRNSGNKQTSKKDKDGKKTCLTNGVGLVIVVIVAVVSIVLGLLYLKESQQPKQPKSFAFQKFAAKVDDLRSIFKSQEPRTWKNIKSSVKHILNGTDPEYPAVVLFAVKKEIDVIASCLAQKVASLFNSITVEIASDGYFDARLLANLEPGKQKESLDEKIHSQLKTGRSVVIDHLEALSPKASLLLHGTCDNDNAPWKNVFIGIVYYVDKDLTHKEVDEELTKYFEKGLDTDKIGALLTRINNNPVVIKEEKEFDSGHCESEF